MDDDEDEMIPTGPDRAGSHSSNDHTIPHHIHGHPGLPHIRHTASASPPAHARNIVGAPGPYPMPGRVGTPQPITRPSSRNQGQRRNSSNLVPANAFPATQPPQQQNGYYMTHQPVYNAQQPGIPMQPSNINQMQAYPYPPPPPQQQTQAQAQAEAFITETSRRQSMPPAFTGDRTGPSSENSPPTRPIEEPNQGPEKRPQAKSRSMFTPIGPSDSMLAQHFGFGANDNVRAHSIDVGAVQRNGVTMGPTSHNVKKENTDYSPKTAPISLPTSSAPSSTSEIAQLPPPPLSRANSMADGSKSAARPNLKLRIPSEQPEGGSPTEGSSPTESGTGGNDSTKARQLPRPSPSPGAILSAGTTGPVNPFARPPPITSGPEQTPMSALPSRFTEGMLSSPSSNMNFYGDWPLPFPQGGRSNGDNMLPSPLNFQTPVGGFGHSSFKDGPITNGKRKSPGPDEGENTAAKRSKT